MALFDAILLAGLARRAVAHKRLRRPRQIRLALPRTSRRLRQHADADSSRQRSSLLVLRLQMRDHSRLRNLQLRGIETWLRNRAW